MLILVKEAHIDAHVPVEAVKIVEDVYEELAKYHFEITDKKWGLENEKIYHNHISYTNFWSWLFLRIV